MAAEPRDVPTEARATLKYLRGAPQKVRLVADLVRGKPVTEALSILKFSPKVVARDITKVLRSAVANAEQSDIGELEDLMVASIAVDAGPSLKRIRPAPMGRAFRFLHRMSHVTLRVRRIDEGRGGSKTSDKIRRMAGGSKKPTGKTGKPHPKKGEASKKA